MVLIDPRHSDFLFLIQMIVQIYLFLLFLVCCFSIKGLFIIIIILLLCVQLIRLIF